MEPAQSNYSYQTPPLKKQAFIFPVNMLLAIVFSLIFGLGLGFFTGQMIKGSSDSKPVTNAVFISQPTYLAPVEGTLAAKDSNKITLENKGSKLDIEVAMTAPAIIQEGVGTGQASTKTIADVELGAFLRGSVQVSQEFMAGDKNGKVTGSAFFVTKQ